MTLTTSEAAALAGIATSSFRGEMTRERARGRDYRAPRATWPDSRTPLWDEESISTWLENRRGTHESAALDGLTLDDGRVDGIATLLAARDGFTLDDGGVDDLAPSEPESTLVALCENLIITVRRADDRLKDSTMRSNGWALRAVEASVVKVHRLSEHLDALRRELQDIREAAE